MEVVPLQHPDQLLDDPVLPHLLLDVGVLAQVHQDVYVQKEELVLLPYQHIQFTQLSICLLGTLPTVLFPQLDVLTVPDVEPLDLVLYHIHRRLPHLELG